MQNHKNLILDLVLVFVVFICGYFLISRNLEPKISETGVSDWVTYKNEELGLEFKYPKNLFSSPYLMTSKGRIINKLNEIHDLPNDREYLSVLELCYLDYDSVYDCYKKIDQQGVMKGAFVINFGIDDDYPRYKSSLSFYDQNKDYSQIKLGNTIGYRYNKRPRNEINSIKLKGLYFIERINMTAVNTDCPSGEECGLNEVEDEENRILFNQIIDTFKVSELDANVEMTNWKKYTNTDYGFEVEYPIGFGDIKKAEPDIGLFDGNFLITGDLYNVGPYSLMVSKDTKQHESMQNWINYYLDIADHQTNNTLERSYNCFKLTIPNSDIPILAVSCAENSRVLAIGTFGLMKNGEVWVFFHSVPNEYGKGATSKEEVRILSTFKFLK